MSLAVNLAVLAEGAATDARGNLTLVAVNPQLLVADELPAQFSPVFVVIVEDDESEPDQIIPGYTLAARIEAKGPDDTVAFFTQMRLVIGPPPNPDVRGRLQLLAQIPFTAAKTGAYTVSAHMAIIAPDGAPHAEIGASRSVKVFDAGSLKSKAG